MESEWVHVADGKWVRLCPVCEGRGRLREPCGVGPDGKPIFNACPVCDGAGMVAATPDGWQPHYRLTHAAPLYQRVDWGTGEARTFSINLSCKASATD